ncbi:MAG: DNA-3-methyladenine glycosylase [Candidatus Bathyarchaeota archaeon]|nr:MAG: DNA-3-methyladenine glycosylase [Candidatus Bathyarchaeota archaeon]
MEERTPLGREFYARDTAQVAQDLLGKALVRKTPDGALTGRIVETEAYYGDADPASRAYRGRKSYNAVMFDEPGRLFIYMVHSWWLLNIVAHAAGEVGAVLIRALEPVDGIDRMFVNRGVSELKRLANGPGKLARALDVGKELHGVDVTKAGGELTVVEGSDEAFEIGSSHRIGVTRDLPRELRFFIEGSAFKSR